MKLMSMVAKFARSPQGRKAAQQAMSYARSPKAKRQIADVRKQLAARRRAKPR